MASGLCRVAGRRRSWGFAPGVAFLWHGPPFTAHRYGLSHKRTKPLAPQGVQHRPFLKTLSCTELQTPQVHPNGVANRWPLPQSPPTEASAWTCTGASANRSPWPQDSAAPKPGDPAHCAPIWRSCWRGRRGRQQDSSRPKWLPPGRESRLIPKPPPLDKDTQYCQQ